MGSGEISNDTVMTELPSYVVSNGTNIFLAAIPGYIDPDITSALLTEVWNCFNLESFRAYVLILMSSLLSVLFDSLLVVGSIAWAIFQHQTVSRLTFALHEMQLNFDSLRSKPFTSSLMFIARFIFNWYLHLTMYVSLRLPIEDSILLLVIISSLPLAIPYDFYSKRPVLSTFYLMCWGQLWLKHIYLGLICPFALSIALLSEILILFHFAELMDSACWAPNGQRWQYFRDNFYAKIVLRSLREIWRVIWVVWPLPTVLLEPLHQQKGLEFYSEVEPGSMHQRQATSKGLHGVNL